MSDWIGWISAAILAGAGWLFFRRSNAASSSGSAGSRTVGANRPPQVPPQVWELWPEVVEAVRSTPYPFGPENLLATIWTEDDTPSTGETGPVGERGLGQMTQIALDDIHANYTSELEGIPQDLEDFAEAGAVTQLRANALFDALNARRCRNETGMSQRECMVRSHNSGYPPEKALTNQYWEKWKRRREWIGSIPRT